jgi:glyoxylase-like metal-dependent hydrolase (beta-lactamase superfamily II)
MVAAALKARLDALERHPSLAPPMLPGLVLIVSDAGPTAEQALQIAAAEALGRPVSFVVLVPGGLDHAQGATC